MSISDQIADLINQEVQKKVQEALSTFAETISKSYKIPLNLLLRDIPNSSSTTTIYCLGIKAGGIRCKMQGKYEGYCRHHFMQKSKFQPTKIIQEKKNIHTHGIPPLYQEGCGACQPPVVKLVPKKRPLIDYSGII